MKKPNKFLPEVRERAVRLVQEYRGEQRASELAKACLSEDSGCVFAGLVDHESARAHAAATPSQKGSGCR